MVVGTLRLSLRLHGCRSLKEKRSPRRSIVDRVRGRFHVAIAEIEDQDVWNQLTLGIAAVGPDREPVERTLKEVADFVEGLGLGELISDRIEILRS